jgi:hypothetical protein
MSDLVKRLRTYDEFEADDALLDEAADRIEELERENKEMGVGMVELSYAHTAARREALEEAARTIECGCPDRDKVALLPPNGGERWRLCGEANCMAIEAAAIRALMEVK